MGRGGKVGCKGNFARRVWSKDEGSDDSDEDYVVSDGKDVVSDDSEDYGSFLDGCASEEEGLGNYLDEDEFVEDEDMVVKEVKKVARPKSRKRRTSGKAVSRKRKKALNDEEEEEEDDEDYDMDDDDEEDDEFTMDEDDCVDEEEEFRITRKTHNKKVGKKGVQRKGPVSCQKRRKKSSSRVTKKKGRRPGLRRKAKSENDDGCTSIEKKPVLREKSRKNPGRSRRRYFVQSDSDLLDSGSSDFEYTISEEEREQIREARELCRDKSVNLRSSTSLIKIEEDSFLGQLKWPPRRKGKEKVEEVRYEVGKQICGICLTEEDKRRVRGTLSCCSHYFCFTCIMAWSKVETRCPLCKQRFHSISKPARLNTGIDLRTVVIEVPERDQVYQPSEEEIRGYLDPYENVFCIECHQGGDDALMLLCDHCDSPAHTYCVGLGWEVPEGNWYCEGCRPIALGSSTSQAQVYLPDQRMTNNLSNRPSPVASFREDIDLNSLPSPHATSVAGFEFLSPPRHSVGGGRVASPATGAGAPTLSGRRWLHRQIFNRMGIMSARSDGISAVNLSRDSLSSQINLGCETAFHPTRTQDMGPPSCTILDERLPYNPSPTAQNRDIFSLRSNYSRGQEIQNSDATVTDRSINGTLWDGFGGINSFPAFEQLYHCSSRRSIGSDDGVSPSATREDGYLHKEKEQVHSMVKSHLQSLPRGIGLDHTTMEEVARRSTHTILAACGLEQTMSEVCLEPQSFICPHTEIVAAAQTSLMKGCCSSCFGSFVREVVNAKLPQWLVGSTRV